MINLPALTLLMLLQTVTGPLRINSGYRSPEHNRRVGGVPTSKHIEGKAFDIATHHLNSKQKQELIKQARQLFDYVKVYKTHIHVHIN